MTSSVTIHPEIKVRFASMGAPLKKLSTTLLKRSSMQPEKRATYAQAYLFSKGLYNCSVWPDLSVSEQRSVHTNIMKVLRRIVVNDPAAHTSDMEVLK
eukprot:3587502-Karenia_brevis.AAC.1